LIFWKGEGENMARRKRLSRKKLEAIMRNLRKAWAARRAKRTSKRKRIV